MLELGGQLVLLFILQAQSLYRNPSVHPASDQNNWAPDLSAPDHNLRILRLKGRSLHMSTLLSDPTVTEKDGPHVQRYSLDDAATAYEDMAAGTLRGRAVIVP